MRIGISLLCAKRARTGTENVAFNLIRALAEVDQKNEYVIFANKQSRDWLSLPDGRFFLVSVGLTFPRFLWFWEHLFFLLDPRDKDLDLVHFPQARGVLGYRGRYVLTIHDLNAYLGLHNVGLRQQFLYFAWYKANVSRASRIVTVSEHMKNQILEHFSVTPEKVRVVYNGVDERFKPISKSASFKANHGLPVEYILFVGSSYGNKNIKRMIEAFWSLRCKRKLDHHLVIAGSPGDQHKMLQRFVTNSGLERIVHFGGYFPDENLPQLYSNASLFVFPTLAEGFGIPPLEALRCGTPVVASDIPVFREVLDESAILVNPYSVDSIAEGMEKALLDVAAREELKRKGFDRARMFSWERTAKEMVNVYEGVVACE